jgi:hypothetical protein
MPSRLSALSADIQRELDSLHGLCSEASDLIDRSGDKAASVEIRAAGSILHDFYTGVEKVFQRIALELDGGMPAGPDWHLDLLLRMTVPVEKTRPAVISKELGRELAEYLRFRHVFRHLYGFELRWDRCRSLLEQLPRLAGRINEELQRFRSFLHSVA